MRAAIGLDQPVRQPQQRGLAGAGAADDGEEFALGDLERDVVDGLHAAAVEALADMRKGDQAANLAFSRPTACLLALQGRVKGSTTTSPHRVELILRRR